MTGRGRHGNHARGPRNGRWSGGRPISRGYVLIPVSPGHPLRMASGYAYEHRLVASEAARRRLEPGEDVHHLAGRADNAPGLLVITPKSKHAAAHAAERARDAGGRFTTGRWACP